MGNQLGESYFAINMSGAIIPVYSPDKWPSKVQIGVLNKKERCVVIQDGPIVRKIKFINSAGSFVDGILDMNAPIKDWNDYVFHDISPPYVLLWSQKNPITRLEKKKIFKSCNRICRNVMQFLFSII